MMMNKAAANHLSLAAASSDHHRDHSGDNFDEGEDSNNGNDDHSGYYEYSLPVPSSFRSFQRDSNGNHNDGSDDGDDDDDASISSASVLSHYGEREGKSNSSSNNDSSTRNLENFPELTCIPRWIVRFATFILILSLMGVISVLFFIVNNEGKESEDEKSSIASSKILGIFGLVLVVALFIALTMYDSQVRRREDLLTSSAQRSMAVVQSLFPSTVQDRILNADYNISTRKLDVEFGGGQNGRGGGGGDLTDREDRSGENDGNNGSNENKTSNSIIEGTKKIIDRRTFTSPIKTAMSMKGDLLSLGSNHSVDLDVDLDNTADTARSSSFSSSGSGTSKPIADYYPSTTVLFTDVVGFTAWSSVRDPSQVFQLLEAIYGAFDVIAKKKGVFKVETIGDCYVAATGIPTPRDDHAVVMASFARRCLDKMLNLVTDLEVSLGPGTAELGLRFGLHSGPTIGGVLRGTKARYQLYGDTMNVSARMESNSMKNKIHLSEQTAELLKKAGKERWVVPRDEKIVAKGKGEMQTYWLCTEPPKNLTKEEKLALPVLLKMMAKAKVDPGFCPTKLATDRPEKAKERLVNYNAKVLEDLLKKIMATRSHHDNLAAMLERTHGTRVASQSMRHVFKETHDDIILPTFDSNAHYVTDPANVELGDVVSSQLRQFVTKIASSYNANPFHCFEHASHTILSVTKLFASMDNSATDTERKSMLDGMLMDPLTQFSVALGALVHDVGYDVPNSQLVKEGSDLTEMYGNHGVAEQHSIDTAWSILMEASFQDLRGCIYQTEEEMERFRSVLTHTVLATDISDPNAAADRRVRWEKAFFSSHVDRWERERLSEERLETQKAMVIIDHIIQLSDVSHTLQHWSVFSKWNRLLFKEYYQTFKAGRADKDPSKDWYHNEMSFFDNHIIPLATRFQDIKSFGADSAVYLKNATANRQEWEHRGKVMVDGYLEDLTKST